MSRPGKPIVKYDYYTNAVIGEYQSIVEAAEQNTDETITKVFQMCTRKNGIKSPRRSYYFRFKGDPPEPHYIIGCYDEDFKLIAKYYSKTQCAEATGLTWSSVCKQLEHGHEELRNRQKTVSGLYLKYIEVK